MFAFRATPSKPSIYLRAVLGLSVLLPFLARGLTNDLPLMYQLEVLAKAAPDECYFGLGNTNNHYVSGGIDCAACLAAGGRPKVNQAYVWGLTRSGSDFWIGTGPNINLLVGGTYFGETDPSETAQSAAEYGLSALARSGVVPAGLGDWRIPDIFVFNFPTRTKTWMNPTLNTNGAALLYTTLGLRSAGASSPNTTHTNGVIILAGPSRVAGNGINMFAFDQAKKKFIACKGFPQYSNIRKWLNYSNVLYTTVTSTNGAGYVLRWENTPTDPAYPFNFTIVGNLDAGGAELTIHEGRMFVATWPGLEGADAQQTSLDPLKLLSSPAGIYMSPTINSGGLTAADAAKWGKVWNIRNYENDTLVSSVTGMGAMQSFGGYLYWGTMTVPSMNDFVHNAYFGTLTDTNEARIQRTKLRRPIAIFRGKDFNPGIPPFLPASANVEMLYGETNLAARNLSTGVWTTNLNATGKTPTYGSGGFGNRRNQYTWTMASYSNRLFIGTLDTPGTSSTGGVLTSTNGADLWCFESTTNAARAVSLYGVGNYSSYGVRTIQTDGTNLFLGMANPYNLLTSTNGDKPLGGWEFLRIRKIFDDKDWNNLDDAWETNYFKHTGVDPNADADGDKVSNLKEFLAGTNPTNAADYLVITNASVVSNQTFKVSWPGRAGRTYRVSQSATAAGPWTPCATITGSNGTASFLLPGDTNAHLFFRLDAGLTPVP